MTACGGCAWEHGNDKAPFDPGAMNDSPRIGTAAGISATNPPDGSAVPPSPLARLSRTTDGNRRWSCTFAQRQRRSPLFLWWRTPIGGARRWLAA